MPRRCRLISRVSDKPGGVANKLAELANAGANLEYVGSRRLPDKPGAGILFIAPVSGSDQIQAAKSVGLHEVNNPVIIRVEGDDESGLAHRLTHEWALAGISFQGLTMSVEERQRVAESVLAQVGGRVPVIIHVGAVAVPDAITLAQHAQVFGANAVSSIIPPRYTTLEAVVRYFEALIDAVPGLGVMPYLLSPQVDPLALLHALLKHPTVIGTKFCFVGDCTE